MHPSKKMVAGLYRLTYEFCSRVSPDLTELLGYLAFQEKMELWGPRWVRSQQHDATKSKAIHGAQILL